MDLASMTAGKKILPEEEKQQEAFPQTLMDRSAKMIASNLKAELCRIFRPSQPCINPSKDQLSIKGIGCTGQPEKLDELAGGISVFMRNHGKPVWL